MCVNTRDHRFSCYTRTQTICTPTHTAPTHTSLIDTPPLHNLHTQRNPTILPWYKGNQFPSKHIAIRSICKTFQPQRSSSVTKTVFVTDENCFCNWRRPSWSKHLTNWPYCYVFAQKLITSILCTSLSIYTLVAPLSLCWCRWYISHIHHFVKWPIISVVSEWNTARPSQIMEHHMGSARRGFTYKITPQSRRASSLKFRLSLCTGCAMFFRLWSLFLACVGAD